MSAITSEKRAGPYRIQLSDELVARFGDKVFHVPVSQTVKRTGLPYLLIYNIVHRRVKSILARHYRILFNEEPSLDGVLKIDGIRLAKACYWFANRWV